jgi:hypothetical protein
MMGLACLVAAAPQDVVGQTESEPIYEQLQQAFQRPYLNLGVLLQTVADFQFDRTMPGNNGFSVANFRLRLAGELDDGFGYVLATSFSSSPAILDAMMYYRPSRTVTLSVGQFKVPVSREFLTYAGSIDFVNRSQAVSALAPGRQIGAQVAFAEIAGSFGLTLGAFNGNRAGANGNDNNSFLYAGRFSGVLEPAEDGDVDARVDFGVNLAHSEDDDLSLVNGLVTDFTGRRTLVGADVRVEFDRYLLSGEIIHASLNPDVGVDRHPWGFQATAGMAFSDKTQGLIRWDGFESDALVGRSDWLVLGFNLWPTAATELQVNYIIDTEDAAADHNQILVNFQFGF